MIPSRNSWIFSTEYFSSVLFTSFFHFTFAFSLIDRYYIIRYGTGLYTSLRHGDSHFSASHFFLFFFFFYSISLPLLLAWSSSAVHLSGIGKEFCCVLTFTSSCELHFLVGIGISWKTGLFILLFFYLLFYPSALHLAVVHFPFLFCLFCSVTMYAIAAVHTVYRRNHELVVCIRLFAPLGSYQTVSDRNSPPLC